LTVEKKKSQKKKRQKKKKKKSKGKKNEKKKIEKKKKIEMKGFAVICVVLIAMTCVVGMLKAQLARWKAQKEVVYFFRCRFFFLTLSFLFLFYLVAQESQFPAHFEGRWTNSLTGGTLSLCVEGNNVFGGFNVGYLTSVLSPDRRTISGVLYSAGNSGLLDEAEFKVSLTGNNQGFVGTLIVNGEALGWSETKTSSAPPHLSFDCYAPDTKFGSTIEGEWATGQGEKMDICLTDDGLNYVASFGGQYHRGPVLPFGKGGRASYWSASEYGGSIVRLVGENSLILSSHTLDMAEVLEHKCGNGPACSSGVLFRRSGATSPSKCAVNSELAIWNGWYSFTAMDGQLVLRRAGAHVYGTTKYGVFEGVTDPSDPLHLSGVWYNAAWKFIKPSKSRYFGTFDIKMSDNLSSFTGEMRGAPNGGNFAYEWHEQRLVGPNREPTADETFSISELSSPDSVAGTDGVWVPEYNENVRFYFCSQWHDDDEEDDDDDDDGLDTDQYGRQTWLGSYTDFGCGRVAGGIRGELELAGFESTEPVATTSNGIWVDDSGFGNQIQRRVTDTLLREQWFAGTAQWHLPNLNFCDPITQIKCGRIDYHLDQEHAVTHEECLHCYKSGATQLVASIFIMLIVVLVTIF
jgi:hypothetical protein